jgi:hypothetical protein
VLMAGSGCGGCATGSRAAFAFTLPAGHRLKQGDKAGTTSWETERLVRQPGECEQLPRVALLGRKRDNPTDPPGTWPTLTRRSRRDMARWRTANT